MNDELAKLDSLRQQGILTEDAYWNARSRLYSPTPMGEAMAAYVLPDTPSEPAYVPTERPSPFPRPDETRSAKHRGRRRRPVLLLVAAVAVVLAASGVGSYFLWFKDTSVSVSATYVLDDDATADAGCEGQGTNSSIVAGSDVRLLDGKSNEIARGKLPKGISDGGRCTFQFRFASVADEVDSYSLVVPGFPRQTMSHDDLKSSGWEFSVKQPPPSGSITGTLELSDSDTATNDCVGTGGYDDIDEGAEVVIRDQDNRILGSGYLDAGTSDGYSSCSYNFTVADIRRDQDQYSVEVTHRGDITASRSELDGRGWTFSLSLGS